MTIHNKLVRDLIPDIIKQNPDLDVEVSTLTNDEYLDALYKKLVEEAEELHGADSEEHFIEELADVYEVFLSIIKAKNLDIREI